MPEGKVMFWNVQHLAEGSSDKKVERINKTLQYTNTDVKLLCEVMATYKGATSEAHTYRRTTGHTLRYAAMNAGLNRLPIRAVDEVRVLNRFAKSFKGGARINFWLVRKLVEIQHGLANWPRLFMIHANAAKGVKCTTVCAMWLADNIAGDWLLVGDFNGTPEKMNAMMNLMTVNVSICPPNGWTHSSGKKTAMLDYAICSPGMTATVGVVRRDESDHRPIVVSWRI